MAKAAMLPRATRLKVPSASACDTFCSADRPRSASSLSRTIFMTPSLSALGAEHPDQLSFDALHAFAQRPLIERAARNDENPPIAQDCVQLVDDPNGFEAHRQVDLEQALQRVLPAGSLVQAGRQRFPGSVEPDQQIGARRAIEGAGDQSLVDRLSELDKRADDLDERLIEQNDVAGRRCAGPGMQQTQDILG